MNNKAISSEYCYFCFIVFTDIEKIYKHSLDKTEQTKYISIYAEAVKKTMSPVRV